MNEIIRQLNARKSVRVFANRDIDESVVNNDIIHHYSNDVCNANVTYRFEDDTQLYTVEAVITNI